jgi:hypothetical protein
MQNWPRTSVMPPDFHEWRRFITPAELRVILERHNMTADPFTGMSARGNPLSHLRMLRKRRQGLITCHELGRYLAERLHFGGNMALSYAGYATKRLD